MFTKGGLPKMFTKINDKIAAVHNFSMGRWGQRLTRKRLNDPSITDRVIIQFIRQCPCCQRIMNTVEKTSTGVTPALSSHLSRYWDLKGCCILLTWLIHRSKSLCQTAPWSRIWSSHHGVSDQLLRAFLHLLSVEVISSFPDKEMPSYGENSLNRYH